MKRWTRKTVLEAAIIIITRIIIITIVNKNETKGLAGSSLVGDPASESVNGSLPMVEQPSELLWQNLIVTHNIDRISYLEKNRMANPMQPSDQQYQLNIPVTISEYQLSLFERCEESRLGKDFSAWSARDRTIL